MGRVEELVGFYAGIQSEIEKGEREISKTKQKQKTENSRIKIRCTVNTGCFVI